jgi:hypothetical protein
LKLKSRSEVAERTLELADLPSCSRAASALPRSGASRDGPRVNERLPHRILLFYANRRPEDAPFLDELRGLASENPNFTVVPTMTNMSDSRRPWNGERATSRTSSLRST